MSGILLSAFALSVVYMAATSRLEAYIKALSIQGVLLFLLACLGINHLTTFHFLLLVFETLCVKAVALPYFLMHVVRKNKIFREVEPSIPNFQSVVITSLIFLFGFMISFWATRMPNDLKQLYFGFSVPVMLSGLFIILSRKKIITHVMGFMLLENGTFMLSLSVAAEMPLIVNLGILLDIFLVVFLLGMVVTHIRSTFSDVDIDLLTDLKD